MQMRFIFTVTPGRSGQSSLQELVDRCCPNVRATFEEPQINYCFPKRLQNFEHRFRRRYIETHELLGRGDVLRAFVEDDGPALRKYAQRRYDWIRNIARDSEVYFDISKYFIRGVHGPLTELVGKPRIVFLVRDPILNMRSFVNRNKNFWLDNNDPSATMNELQLTADGPVEFLYLWAWLEGYLRGVRLISDFDLAAPVVIRTSDLEDTEKMAQHFTNLELPFDSIETIAPINTNVGSGLRPTEVNSKDVETFERFRDRVPESAWRLLPFMNNYDPRAFFATTTA